MKKLFLTLLFISTVFTADDLLSIYNEALERDPEFNSKKADLKISKEFTPKISIDFFFSIPMDIQTSYSIILICSSWHILDLLHIFLLSNKANQKRSHFLP